LVTKTFIRELLTTGIKGCPNKGLERREAFKTYLTKLRGGGRAILAIATGRIYF